MEAEKTNREATADRKNRTERIQRIDRIERKIKWNLKLVERP